MSQDTAVLPCGHPAYICDGCGHPHCPVHGSRYNDEMGYFCCPKCGYEYGFLMQMRVAIETHDPEHTGDQAYPS